MRNVGLDIGYSATKLVSGNDRVQFPSAVGTPDKGRFSLNGNDGSIILTTPAHVQVGDAAVVQSRFLNRREDRGWVESDEWYYLALAALTEVISGSVNLTVVTGLPIAFYSDKDVVRDRLLGEHKVQRECGRNQTLTVTDCRVIPQPFGALLSAALNDNGKVCNDTLATGTVGVIDVGGKTTNLLSVDRLSEIGRETASVNIGAWDVVRAVKNWLTDNCPSLELRDHQVVDAIVDHGVRYYGETIDLSDVVKGAVGPLANQVLAEATQIWNGGASLDGILVSGGGALLLGDHVKGHFRHARVVDDPVFANAIGFYRYSQFLGR